MPVDASIYGQIQQPKVTSPMDALLHAYQLQDAQLGSQQKQQAFADEQAYRQAAQQAGGDMNALYKLLSSSNPTKALELQKKMLEQQKTQAEVSHLGAQSGKLLSENDALKMAQHRDQLTNVNTPEDALAWAQQGVSQGIMKPEQYQMAQASIQQAAQSPQAFQDWKQKNALGMTKFIELNKPTVHVQNLGGTSQVVSTPGLGGAANVLSNTPITQSADSVASNARALQIAQMQDARARATNAATIAKDLQIAGITPDGKVDANTEKTAQAIASGQLPAPTGMALLNPKNQRILGRVMEINPSYDFTEVAAKKKAATDFTSGTLGNSMRSFAVAGQHLDQLGQLVDAMNNGNMNIVNKIGNAYSTQTGNPAPTNFEAAKDIVSKEVVKAIVAGGGGVTERQELSHLMENARSPAQLKGIISQYRNLMGAQHDALLQQRRAAGLKDETLPKYQDANGSPNTPASGVPAMSAIDAEIARRRRK